MSFVVEDLTFDLAVDITEEEKTFLLEFGKIVSEFCNGKWNDISKCVMTKWEWFLLLDFVVKNNQIACKRNLFPCKTPEDCPRVFFEKEKEDSHDSHIFTRLHSYTLFAHNEREFYKRCIQNKLCKKENADDASLFLWIKPDDFTWTCKYLASHGHCLNELLSDFVNSRNKRILM